MIVLGLILAILGYFLGIGLLEGIGVIIAVIGAILFVLGQSGRPVGGRRYWY